MSLSYILSKIAPAAGCSSYAVGTKERDFLVNLVNAAAEEIWEEGDLPGSLREAYLTVTPNRILALPSFMGELRAVRDCNFYTAWRLQDMRPRYMSNPWSTLWDKWRFIGYSPLCAQIGNSAPFVYKIDVADATVIVTATGATVQAARAYDIVTMNVVQVNGTQNFVEPIESITVNKIPAGNIEIYDVDGNLMSVLFNNALESRYMLYDITEFPSGDQVVEVLYKMRLEHLVNDGDAFPIPDFDSIVSMKVSQLLAEGQEGKEDRAAMMHNKIQWRMHKKVDSKAGGVDKKLSFGSAPLQGLFDGYYSSRRNI